MTCGRRRAVQRRRSMMGCKLELDGRVESNSMKPSREAEQLVSERVPQPLLPPPKKAKTAAANEMERFLVARLLGKRRQTRQDEQTGNRTGNRWTRDHGHWREDTPSQLLRGHGTSGVEFNGGPKGQHVPRLDQREKKHETPSGVGRGLAAVQRP